MRSSVHSIYDGAGTTNMRLEDRRSDRVDPWRPAPLARCEGLAAAERSRTNARWRGL